MVEAAKQDAALIVGIDLGTTCSSIAYWDT